LPECHKLAIIMSVYKLALFLQLIFIACSLKVLNMKLVTKVAFYEYFTSATVLRVDNQISCLYRMTQ